MRRRPPAFWRVTVGGANDGPPHGSAPLADRPRQRLDAAMDATNVLERGFTRGFVAERERQHRGDGAVGAPGSRSSAAAERAVPRNPGRNQRVGHLHQNGWSAWYGS